MARRRQNGAAALEDTRQLLADVNNQIAEQRRRRADELRGAADNGELDRLDDKIKRLEAVAARHRERVALLEQEAKETEARKRAAGKQDLIARIEKRLGEDRQNAVADITAGITQADRGLRKLIDIAHAVQAAWPWQMSDLGPTLLGPSAIVAALTHELYRLGGRPLLLGGQDKRFGAGISFPGGKSPRLELAGLPENITPLATVMAEATTLASQVMRSGRSLTAAPLTAETLAEGDRDRQRTPAQLELATLLQRQNQLAADTSPEGEAAYPACVTEIARVQSLIEVNKQMEQENV